MTSLKVQVANFLDLFAQELRFVLKSEALESLFRGKDVCVLPTGFRSFQSQEMIHSPLECLVSL